MNSNPFDQFDEGAKNPFDQFDSSSGLQANNPSAKLSPAMQSLEQIQPSTPQAQGTPEVEEPWIKPTVGETVQRGLANTMDLWANESLPAHMISAYQKGVFDKPVGELVQSGGDVAKEAWENFKPGELFEAAAKDPGKFAKGLIKAVVADPELLMAPVGLGGRMAAEVSSQAARLGVTAGRVGKAVGTAGEVGVAGAGLSTPVDIAEQLDEHGFVDPARLAANFGTNFTVGAALGAVMSAGGLAGKARPEDIERAARWHMDEGDNFLTAVEKSLQDHGVEGAQAKELTDALEAPYRDEAAAEKDSAKQRIESGEAATVGQEPSALQARADFLDGKRTLTPSEAKEFHDIKTYLDVLPELDAPTKEIQVMTPSQAKAWIEARLPEAPLDTVAKVEAPEALTGQIPKNMKERGIVDPEMARWAALGIGGAAIGGYLSDDKASGAVLGAALALGGGAALKAGTSLIKAGVSKADEALAKFNRDPKIAKQVDGLISAHEGYSAAAGLASDRLGFAIERLVPDTARREALIHAVQEGRVPELKRNEQIAAKLFQKQMAEWGDRGQKAGVLDDLISDGSYVTQLWENEGKARAFYSSMRGKTRFAEDRLVPNYKTGIELGLKPTTMDLAEIARIYGKSISKAIANKELLNSLKLVDVAGTEGLSKIKEKAVASAKTREDKLAASRLPETSSPVMRATDAPADYVALNHPQLQGYLVNPEMAPSLSHLFYSNNIPAYLQAATAVSAAAKQGLLSLSGFHAKSLLEVGAGIALGLQSPKTLTKIPEMYKALKNGSAGDFVESAVKNGLKIDAHGFDMDTGAFSKLAGSIVDKADKIPVLGKAVSLPIKGVTKLADGMNWFLWEYLHPSVKLATANVAYSKALEREAGKLAKDPSYKAQSPQQIMKEVASTTNDLFGGINWRQVSGEIENKFMHQLMASRTNPEGMRGLRVGLLAPDWLASTVRAGYKGIKATLKSVIPGTKLTVGEDLYRRYFLGGALMTATVMEGLQQSLTGTHFWDNPDPTYVYFPDGRKIQIAKHFNEIFHWIREFTATAVDKLGYVPKEAAAQLLGKEYVSAKGMPPMENPSIPGRVMHAAKGMLPIGVQEAAEGRGLEAVSGTLGAPIRGKTRQELEEAKRRRSVEISRRMSRQQKRSR